MPLLGRPPPPPPLGEGSDPTGRGGEARFCRREDAGLTMDSSRAAVLARRDEIGDPSIHLGGAVADEAEAEAEAGSVGAAFQIGRAHV